MDEIIRQLLEKEFQIPMELAKEIHLDLDEEMLIDTLKNIVDTSWGRDTLTETSISSWLKNFQGKVYQEKYERVLALILAVNIVYYNERNISYLSRIAYKRLLHEIIEEQKWELERAINSVVFYPLGKVSESGPFLAYYFRKENQLPVNSFVSSAEGISRDCRVKNIVFLDDVSFSGEQIKWYFSELKKQNPLWKDIINKKKIYALMLMATNQAKKNMKENGIQLSTPILMDERSKCFSESSVIYKMFEKEYRDQLREQSRYMAQYYGYRLVVKLYSENGELYRLRKKKMSIQEIEKKILKDSLGYGDSQALIAFEYNTPNNSLPIIWADNEEWQPLFKRYDKLYTAKLIRGISNENIYI